jgi:hypothetical protein
MSNNLRAPDLSPAGIYLPITREMLDIDMFAVNLPTNDPRTLATLIQFVGNTVMLSTARGRNWHQEAWDFMVLTYNPVITLTVNSQQVKEELCNFFSAKGHVVLPSGEGARHMVIGHPKPVPSATFLQALVNSEVPYIRLTNYGMKQPILSFPDLPRQLLECDASEEGYPENEWDVSFSRRTQYVYMARALPPVPHNVTVDLYPVLTTLSFQPFHNLGGNITLNLVDSIIAPQVLKLKMYNVLYHLLRASNPFPLPAPNNTRQAARRFEKLASILNVLTNNQERVGGIRVELRVRHKHLEDAITMVLRPNAFTPECYGVTMQYYTISVPIYLGKARRIFALARAILTREGVLRHHVTRLLTLPEKMLFGDLKLLLGYRHAGYHTVIGAFNNWWRNDGPEPLRIQPRILLQPNRRPAANGPPAAMDVHDVQIPNPVPNRNPNDNQVPPPLNVDNMLILIARDNRAARGERRINWARVHAAFTQRYPQDGRTKDQLKNRVHTLVHRNPNLLQ